MEAVSPVIDPSIEKIADKIFLLESSNGKNDQKCGRLGKANGYGFRQGIGRNYCLNSHSEVRSEVIEWFKEKLKTHSLPEAVCGYNLGFQSEHLKDCINKSPEYPYYSKYLKS